MTTNSTRLLLRTAYLAALTQSVGPGSFGTADDVNFDTLDAMADGLNARGGLNGRLAPSGSVAMPKADPLVVSAKVDPPVEVQPERAYDAEDEGARGVAGAYQGEGVDPDATEEGSVQEFKPTAKV